VEALEVMDLLGALFKAPASYIAAVAVAELTLLLTPPSRLLLRPGVM
jgi:hypothetical protein